MAKMVDVTYAPPSKAPEIPAEPERRQVFAGFGSSLDGWTVLALVLGGLWLASRLRRF